MSVLPVGIAASGDEGYTLDNSLRFRSSASAYLNRTPSTAGNRKTYTLSAWFKRGALTVNHAIFSASDGTQNNEFLVWLSSTNSLSIQQTVGGTASGQIYCNTNALFRDPSAWYHMVLSIDTTQGTSTDRLVLYINGVAQTFSSYTVGSSINTWVNNTNHHAVGKRSDASLYLDGYLTEINFIDGQALTADDFGEFDGTTGVWKPKAYSGTYGTNGFYLPTTATTQAEGFNTVLFTGTSAANQTISDVGFQPDLVWLKSRSNAQNHYLIDSVRGGNSFLYSNATNAENTSATWISSFNSDGFTATNNVISNGYTYAAWCWDAGSGSPVTNTAGSINSTVKANPEKGFSIVNWVGNGASSAYVGTGLSSTAPLGMAIVKRIDSTSEWQVGHIGNQGSNFAYHLELNSTAANSGSSPYFMGSQSSTDGSLLYLSSGSLTSGGEYIAYCFESIPGYSKFGGYTGTGSSGNSVTTGFRPAFLMIKSTDATSTGWIMVDNTRDPDNLASEYIYADSSAAEATYTNILEFTDTGFELIIGAGSAVNQSGVNYIYMAFADTRDAQFNFDASGNKNNWTPNNINSNASSESSYDIMTDVPTLTDENTANYCTLNNIKYVDNSPTYSYANLRYSTGSSWSTQTYIEGTIGPLGGSTGKYYWEVSANYTADYYTAGVALQNNTIGATNIGTTGSVMVYYASKYVNGTATSSYITPVPANGVLGVALDASNGKVWFRNSSGWGSSGDPAAGTNEAGIISGFSGKRLMPVFQSNLNATVTANFGQRPFAYTPPTGFLPLNTYNLPDSTIEDGSEHFNTVLYTGDGGSARAVTGVGFQPDFAWFKARSTTYSHQLHDAVRGAGNALFSNLTNVEGAINTVTSFDSDGVTLDASTYAGTNGSGDTFASWYWKANGSGVSNTVGDTNATVSANTTSGFSIVSFNAGAAGNHTVGHGLGVTPEMIIMKDRDSSGYGNWTVFHSAVCTSTSNYLLLNGTGGLGSVANSWGSALPTSTVFGFGSNVNVAANDDIIAYCFASVEGFSAFGKYTGNGSTDGPFIYTGFRPAWVMVKRTSSSGTEWILFDNKRDTYNEVIHYLFPSSSVAESTATAYYGLDFVSNGFKWRKVHTPTNSSGATYIYAAFAENPFKNSLAR